MSFNENDFVFEFTHSRVDPYILGGQRRYTHCYAYDAKEFGTWLTAVRAAEKDSAERFELIKRRPRALVATVSMCRPGDNFCKATGRAKSKGRAIQKLKQLALVV